MDDRVDILCLFILLQVSSFYGVSALPSIDVTVTPPDPGKTWEIRITCTVNPGPGGLQHDVQINHPTVPRCVSVSHLTGRCNRDQCRSYGFRCEPRETGDGVTLRLRWPSYIDDVNNLTHSWSCQYGQNSQKFDLVGRVMSRQYDNTIVCAYISPTAYDGLPLAIIYPPWVSSGSESSQHRCAEVRWKHADRGSCTPILGSQCRNPALAEVTCERNYQLTVVKLVLNPPSTGQSYYGNWRCAAGYKNRTITVKEPLSLEFTSTLEYVVTGASVDLTCSLVPRDSGIFYRLELMRSGDSDPCVVRHPGNRPRTTGRCLKDRLKTYQHYGNRGFYLHINSIKSYHIAKWTCTYRRPNPEKQLNQELSLKQLVRPGQLDAGRTMTEAIFFQQVTLKCHFHAPELPQNKAAKVKWTRENDTSWSVENDGTLSFNLTSKCHTSFWCRGNNMAGEGPDTLLTLNITVPEIFIEAPPTEISFLNSKDPPLIYTTTQRQPELSFSSYSKLFSTTFGRYFDPVRCFNHIRTEIFLVMDLDLETRRNANGTRVTAVVGDQIFHTDVIFLYEPSKPEFYMTTYDMNTKKYRCTSVDLGNPPATHINLYLEGELITAPYREKGTTWYKISISQSGSYSCALSMNTTDHMLMSERSEPVYAESYSEIKGWTFVEILFSAMLGILGLFLIIVNIVYRVWLKKTRERRASRMANPQQITMVDRHTEEIDAASERVIVSEQSSSPHVTGMVDVEVDAGNDASITALVTGVPEPSVTWQHRGCKIKLSDKYHVGKEGNRQLMQIYNCTKADSGVVGLRATNSAGVFEIMANLMVLETEIETGESQSGTCDVLDIARQFIQDKNLSDEYFDHDFDVCYCEICHTSRGDKCVYMKGKPPTKYGLPVGWCKFGLKTKPQAKALVVFENWHTAFHGTTVDALDKILETGDLLVPGDKTPHGYQLTIPKTHWDPKHEDPKMRPPPGHNVKKCYLSPSIRYSGCQVYAPKYSWRQHIIRTAFQVRIKPGSYQIGKQTIGVVTGGIDPLFPNAELEWSTDRRGVTILVGLLVKVEDMVGNPSREIPAAGDIIAEQKEPGTFMAEFKRDFVHERSSGKEVVLKAGEKCWVMKQADGLWEVTHPNVNEPLKVMAHYMRKL